MQELQVKGERYYLDKKVGSGCSADVFKAVSGKGETLCVKVISPQFYSSQLGQDLINNEISILSRLDHANILKFYKKETRDRLMIVTEYCPDGTLFDHLGRRRTFPEEEALQIVRGVVRGCDYMLGRGILHRDLKPQNIFLKGKNIKIADFGFAVQTNNTKLMAVNAGSPLYMPYESLQEKKFSAKSDIFAIGVIWYQLISGKTPFQASSQSQLKERMRAGAYRLKELPCNKKTQDLIFRCLSFKTQHRPTIQELSAAVQELATPQKEKSKTFYGGFTIKKAEKENLNKTVVMKEPTKTASKETTRLKTASTKISESSNSTRPQRCKTILNKQESKDPFTDYIKATLSRRPSQQKADQRKKEAASQAEREKADKSFMDYLLKLQKLNLPFLPLSVQLKFTSLVSAYHHLLSRKQAPKMPQKDDMLSVLATCTKQSQFCKCCLTFVRRLIRLAKSYKQCSGCLKELGALWQRVERHSGGA